MVDVYDSLGNNVIDIRYIMGANDEPVPNDGVCISVKRAQLYGWLFGK